MEVHTPAATSDELSSGGRRSTYRPPLAENGSISAIISSVTGPSDTKSTGCCFFAGTLPVFTCRRYASMHASVHVHLHVHMLYASKLGCRRERMHRAASGRLLRRGPTCPPSPPMCRETAHTHACERMQTCIQLCARRHVHVCARSRTGGRAVRLRRRPFGVAERMRHCLAVAHLRPARLSRYTAHGRYRQGHHGSRVVNMCPLPPS